MANNNRSNQGGQKRDTNQGGQKRDQQQGGTNRDTQSERLDDLDEQNQIRSDR